MGLTKEQADYIMTEGNRSLAANYVLASDMQGKIDAAVQEAQKAAAEAVDPKTSKEYIDLLNERDMLRAIGGDDFASVKPKFRETVFGMLDRSEKAKPVADQLSGIAEKYEEYFVPVQQPEQPKAPTWGAPTQGSAPTGKQGPSFMDTWKFVPPNKN